MAVFKSDTLVKYQQPTNQEPPGPVCFLRSPCIIHRRFDSDIRLQCLSTGQRHSAPYLFNFHISSVDLTVQVLTNKGYIIVKVDTSISRTFSLKLMDASHVLHTYSLCTNNA